MQYTYDTLLASCQNYCVDNSTQYTTEFPNIVQLSEMMIIKILNLSVFDTTSTGTMVISDRTVPKPTDFIAIQDFFIIVNGNRVYLQPRSRSFIDYYAPNNTAIGQPKYFCENNTDNWIVAPTPDQLYPYQINYIVRPTPMSSSNQQTWIGNKLGECLLYATLLGSMKFFKEDVVTEQGYTKEWENTFNNSIALAKQELAPMNSAKDDNLVTLTTTINL